MGLFSTPFTHQPYALGHLEEVSQCHSGKIGLVGNLLLGGVFFLVRTRVPKNANFFRPISNVSCNSSFCSQFMQCFNKRVRTSIGVNFVNAAFKRFAVGHCRTAKVTPQPATLCFKKSASDVVGNKIWRLWLFNFRPYLRDVGLRSNISASFQGESDHVVRIFRRNPNAYGVPASAAKTREITRATKAISIHGLFEEAAAYITCNFALSAMWAINSNGGSHV